MTFSAPKSTSWFVGLGLGVVSLLLHYGVVHVGVLAPYSFFMLVAGWVLLLVATATKGL
jgi:hypothetical protein